MENNMDGGPCPPGANVQEMRDGSQMIHKTNKVTIQIRVKEGEGPPSMLFSIHKA